MNSKTSTSNPLIRTLGTLVTAVALVAPGLGAAGPFDQARKRVQNVTSNVTQTVRNTVQSRPLATGFQNLTQNVPGTDLIEQLQELELRQQFENSRALLEQIQVDYQYFSGGAGCGAECANFRTELKGLFSDFLLLVDEVPALSSDSRLIETLQRASGLVDYVPPRALYLMWQAIGSRLDDLQSVPGEIRQVLAMMPPLEDVASAVRSAIDAQGQQIVDSRMCEWANKDKKPFVALYQGRLEHFAWALSTIEGFIPDVEAEGEFGVEAGVAVGMVTGSIAVSAKPTDSVKMALKVMAVVPQSINWMIKINMLRADAVCAAAEYAAGLE